MSHTQKCINGIILDRRNLFIAPSLITSYYRQNQQITDRVNIYNIHIYMTTVY